MSTTRRQFLAAAAALPLGAQPDRPNIIFILADDLGWGDLGCYGNKRTKTPNLDRLAAQGLLYKQFYVAAAVCSPSRSSFMTGRFTNRHGVHGHYREKANSFARGLPPFLDPAQPMLPRLLHDAGYATAHFGKWHLCPSDSTEAARPPAYGFDDHRVTVCDGDGLHRLPPGVPGWNVWEGARPGPKWHEWRSRSSELVMDEAIRFIGANRNRPFYVNAWTFDTHAKLVPTETQQTPFASLGTPWRIYYSALADLDRHIGRLLAKLDEWNLANNTIIVFSSDNGPEDIIIGNASEHGVGNAGPFRGRKRSGYEGGIRVPLIVRWPKGVPAGQVNESTVVGAVDLLPTLCRLAGVQPPAKTEIGGEDMSEAFRGKQIRRSRPLFWDLHEETVGDFIHKSPRLIIREGEWKLMMNPDGSAELYNIPQNGLEVDNLADRHPDVVKRLSARLLDWKRNPAVTFSKPVRFMAGAF